MKTTRREMLRDLIGAPLAVACGLNLLKRSLPLRPLIETDFKETVERPVTCVWASSFSTPIEDLKKIMELMRRNSVDVYVIPAGIEAGYGAKGQV